MALSIGIVGLPNVGKSTLFTAMTNKGGLAANYPFATIEPNVGIVPVPDDRLQALAEIEEREELLTGKVCTAPDGERWTLRKLLRRFLWHDRIHARAMWRTAAPLWGSAVADPFGFR